MQLLTSYKTYKSLKNHQLADFVVLKISERYISKLGKCEMFGRASHIKWRTMHESLLGANASSLLSKSNILSKFAYHAT